MRAGRWKPSSGLPASANDQGRFTAPLLVLFFVNVLNFYDRQALGAVTEPLRREFQLSDTQVGGITTAFTIVYALAGLPLGRWADNASRRRLLAMGTTVWAGLTALGALARSYTALLITRLGVGVGEATCAPAATSWIGDIVPPERRARAMAWFMSAVPLGGMLSFAVTGPAAQAWGWRAALALAAAPAIILVPALLFLREPQRATASDGPSISEPPASRPWPAVFWWIVASGAVLNFTLYSFSTFLPALLTRFHGLSVASAGVWTGIGAGIAGLAGALGGGAWGDRARQDRCTFRLRSAAVAALAASPLAYLAIRAPAGHQREAITLIMLAYGLLQTYYGLTYAAIQDAIEPARRGAAMGVYFMAMYLCGASFGPLVTGRLSDHFARAAAGAGPITETARALGLRDAMFLIPTLAAALAAVLWVASISRKGAAPVTS